MLDGVAAEHKPDGAMALRVRIGRGAGFLERFRPAVTERTYELDRFGGFVVDEIDGKRNVLSIIDAFQERFRMSRRESELGVVAFLKILLKRNLIAIVAKD